MKRTPNEIVREIADRLGVEVDLVRAAGRTPTALRAKRIAVYVLRRDRGCTWGEISVAFGGADRSALVRMYRREAEHPDPEIARFLGWDA